MSQIQVTRDKTIDILRGIAIVLMVMGNLQPVLQSPHPFWLRAYGSFAAPIFIILSGMMVGLTRLKKKHNFNYYLRRGLILIIIGALIDLLIWNIIPFSTIDVLYLIGLAIPLSYGVHQLKTWQSIILIMGIFLGTIVLQNFLGYSAYPDAEKYLSALNTINLAWFLLSLRHWLIDGWFPIFPWLGYAFFGILVSRLRWQLNYQKKFLYWGLFLFALGLSLWVYYPGALYEREGYSELFYPPVIGFNLTALGLFLGLLFLVDLTKNIPLYKYFQVLGECSLFMYILHSVILGWIIFKIWSDISLFLTLSIYIILIVALLGIGLSIRRYKRHHQLSSWLKFLLGS